MEHRIAIARALMNESPVLFADEPTGNLVMVWPDRNRKGQVKSGMGTGQYVWPGFGDIDL